jgi:hypothetical protein
MHGDPYNTYADCTINRLEDRVRELEKIVDMLKEMFSPQIEIRQRRIKILQKEESDKALKRLEEEMDDLDDKELDRLLKNIR